MPPPRKDKNQIEAGAKKLLDDCGIQNIPVPIEKIAKSLGAQLRFAPVDEELSGMVFIKDAVPIIGINSLHHPNRQRFTIAHEIAHLRLHPDHITSAVHVDKQFADSVLKRDPASATGTERLEIEANQFAAALLVPKDTLLKMVAESPIDLEDEQSLETLAKKFKVSKAMLQYRMRNLT